MSVIGQIKTIRKKALINRLLEHSKSVHKSSRLKKNDDSVICLTSYAPRFKYLHLVLKSLIWQKIPCDVVVYIEPDEVGKLPGDVLALKDHGLRIGTARNIRSYSKIIPALDDYPDRAIITVDDDVIYSADTVATLLDGTIESAKDIVCRRAHRISRAIDNVILPYESWAMDIGDDYARRPSIDILPTGVGGVLYPPGSLHRDVMNVDLAMKLAPRADDLWLYFMGRKNGTKHRKVGDIIDLVHTPDSQEIGLRQVNVIGGNTEQWANLVAEFGLPPGLEGSNRCEV